MNNNLNKIENIIQYYFKYLDNKEYNNNHINEYKNILNDIKNNYNCIINYIYNINNNIYINFCNKHNIFNINNIFINNITNIEIRNKTGGASKSEMIQCLYNNKPAIIKIFYNPFIDIDNSYNLFYEQLVNLKIKNYQNLKEGDIYSKFVLPEIYEVGYIDYDTLFNKEFKYIIYNLISNIYDIDISDDHIDIKNYFKHIIKSILENETENLNEDSYKFRLFKDYHNKKNNFWVELLLFFLNLKNKYIHISVVEDLTRFNEMTNIINIYYNLNYINDNNRYDFKDEFYIILYQIFYCIYLLNDKIGIIHNDIHLENIIILKDSNKIYRCVIIDFNLSYIIDDIFNIGILKRYNHGIKNIYDKSYDIFVFITFLGTICNYMHTNKTLYEKCTLLDQTYNIYTYNYNNYKYLNKILFKKNKLLKNIVIEHIILYLNKVINVPILYYNQYEYKNNLSTAYDFFNNKYIIKKLKKINYL
jgi:hypothetical protein